MSGDSRTGIRPELIQQVMDGPKLFNPVILSPVFGRRACPELAEGISRNISDLIAVSWLFHQVLVNEPRHSIALSIEVSREILRARAALRMTVYCMWNAVDTPGRRNLAVLDKVNCA